MNKTQWTNENRYICRKICSVYNVDYFLALMIASTCAFSC